MALTGTLKRTQKFGASLGNVGGQGPQGPPGPPGPPGAGIQIQGTVPTEADLPATGNPGEAWITQDTRDLWVWQNSGGWLNTGPVEGPEGAGGPQGPAGAVGARGPTGPDGPQGVQGPSGATGPQGAQGPQGTQGQQGLAGQDGAEGPEGRPGTTGPAGPQGDPGDPGATGTTGPIGPQGPFGPTGATGATGLTGATGPMGPTGPQGSGAQTPWISSIEGAGYNLDNVGALGVGRPASTLAPIMITVPPTTNSGVRISSATAASLSQIHLENSTLSSFLVGIGGSSSSIPNLAFLNTNSPGIVFQRVSIEVARVTSTGFGIFNAAPSWALDVNGDINFTGALRQNGQPIQNRVLSVFGRIGEVVAQSGDYTAAQVDYAVSVQGAYADPPWITSLSWSKIIGVGSSAQTPWVANIDAADFALNNVSAIGVAQAASPADGMITVESDYLPALFTRSHQPLGAATVRFENDIDSVGIIGMTGSRHNYSVDTLNVNTFGAGISFAMSNTEIARINELGLGIFNVDPQYPFDVVGDINVTGLIRVNGVPIVTGGVASVFGRMGAVIAQTGDYFASQVYGAVDATTFYANPSWITSLAWNKITGAPAIFPQTPWASDINAAGYNLETVGAIGIRLAVNTLIPLQVGGDVNITGLYRQNGIPINFGVASVFGRSGSVVATAGDYWANQVVNAVDESASYPDPAWITSLAWSKITGAPAPVGQTPWLSNIDAAGYSLQSVGILAVGTATASVWGMITVAANSPGIAALQCINPAPNGLASIRFENDVGHLATLGLGGSLAGVSPDIFNVNMNAAAFTVSMSNIEKVRVNTTGLGVLSADPHYPLDVAGDCNITGSYRVNGTPITLGQAQTPWLQNVNAAMYNLSSVGALGIGVAANASFPFYIFAAVSPQIVCVNSSASNGAQQIFYNDLSRGLLLGAYGSTNPAGPGQAFLSMQGPVDLLFMSTTTERMRLTNGGLLGIGNPAPAYALDVTGDVNCTGAYRVDGAPIGSLTPWTSNIDAANFDLANVNGIGVGGPTSGGARITVVSDILPGMSVISNHPSGAASVGFQNNAGNLLVVGVNGSAAATWPNTANLNTSAAGIVLGMSNVEKLRVNTTGVGVLQSNPQFQLDVTGDINCTGQYRVNGTPVAPITVVVRPNQITLLVQLAAQVIYSGRPITLPRAGNSWVRVDMFGLLYQTAGTSSNWLILWSPSQNNAATVSDHYKYGTDPYLGQAGFDLTFVIPVSGDNPQLDLYATCTAGPQAVILVGANTAGSTAESQMCIVFSDAGPR
ncbi:MAG TPA: hypothetical protein VIX19_11645 [Terriglobales bacterium]